MRTSDVIIAGAGIGGLTAGALLARKGFPVTVLEAATVPGGCASSFEMHGITFDAGATTLVGFEKNQPLLHLETLLGKKIPKKRLEVPMLVSLPEGTLTRFESAEDWITESSRFFGETEAQQRFWKQIFSISNRVWEISSRVSRFPPRSAGDFFNLATSLKPLDATVVPYAFVSVESFARSKGISNPAFYRFLDAQLMITTQAPASDTPVLVGAPALTYTNGGNYLLEGGIGSLAGFLADQIETAGGRVLYRHRASTFKPEKEIWLVEAKRTVFTAIALISNLTVWDTKALLPESLQPRINAARYRSNAAFTLYLKLSGSTAQVKAHHQQILCGPVPNGISESIFVSFNFPVSKEPGENAIFAATVSTHTPPDFWFGEKEQMLAARDKTAAFMLDVFKGQFPFLDIENPDGSPASPFTWQRWAGRAGGRVGGIPQSMSRMPWDWPDPNPLPGLYLASDSIWPGQGIPAVVLSGIHAAERVNAFLKR